MDRRRFFQSFATPSFDRRPEFAPSLPSPAEVKGPRDVDTTMVVASSLPTDVLLEIFLRLEPTDVIRCAAVCKPWRRAIIGNAASLRRRPDRFDPRLLLGVFHFSRFDARLRRAPGPFQSALPSVGSYETARSLIPIAAAAAGFDRGMCRELLWSADRVRSAHGKDGCLFNPMTGDCTFLPAAAASKCSAYVLLTGGNKKLAAVRILAMQKRDTFMFSKEEAGLSYQVCSFTSGAGDSAGAWGPVQRSAAGDESEEVEGGLCMWMERRSTLVCRDAAVYWLAGPRVRSITCTLALDVRTGRTWTTELPQRYRFNSRARPDSSLPILATSGDGRRLSLTESLRGPRIKVWVMLDGDGDDARWSLQQTIAIDVVSVLMQHCPDPDDPFTVLIKALMTNLSLSAFGPRSGCVVGVCLGRELLIDIHSGSPPRVSRIVRRRGHDC